MSLLPAVLEGAKILSQNAELGGVQAVGAAAFLGLVEGWAAEQGQYYDYAKSWSRWFFALAFLTEEALLLANRQYEVAGVLALTFAIGVGAHHVPSLGEN